MRGRATSTLAVSAMTLVGIPSVAAEDDDIPSSGLECWDTIAYTSVPDPGDIVVPGGPDSPQACGVGVTPPEACPIGTEARNSLGTQVVIKEDTETPCAYTLAGDEAWATGVQVSIDEQGDNKQTWRVYQRSNNGAVGEKKNSVAIADIQGQHDTIQGAVFGKPYPESSFAAGQYWFPLYGSMRERSTCWNCVGEGSVTSYGSDSGDTYLEVT